MTLHIACDVCRRAYQVDDARLGSTLTCKECSVPFEVRDENVIDPDAPELPDADEEPPPSEWAQVWRCTVNGVGVLGVILALVGMTVLLFRDPRAPGERLDGTVRIHDRGWSDHWDKGVTRDRIQLTHEE